jgi:hypothetical protein
LDDVHAAEAACRSALLIDPSYIKAKHRLGDALRRLGRLPEVCVLVCIYLLLVTYIASLYT